MTGFKRRHLVPLLLVARVHDLLPAPRDSLVRVLGVTSAPSPLTLLSTGVYSWSEFRRCGSRNDEERGGEGLPFA